MINYPLSYTEAKNTRLLTLDGCLSACLKDFFFKYTHMYVLFTGVIMVVGETSTGLS